MRMIKVFAAIAALMFIAACSNNNEQAAAPAGATVTPGSVADFRQNVGDRVYFDTDASTVREDGRQTLNKQAAWLKQYANYQVTIEGNCDERGTREYNLALGARRAASVKAFLTEQGVAASRITTISYGKEHPIDLGSGDDALAHNRNAHTALTSGAN